MHSEKESVKAYKPVVLYRYTHVIVECDDYDVSTFLFKTTHSELRRRKNSMHHFMKMLHARSEKEKIVELFQYMLPGCMQSRAHALSR